MGGFQAQNDAERCNWLSKLHQAVQSARQLVEIKESKTHDLGMSELKTSDLGMSELGSVQTSSSEAGSNNIVLAVQSTQLDSMICDTSGAASAAESNVPLGGKGKPK